MGPAETRKIRGKSAKKVPCRQGLFEERRKKKSKKGRKVGVKGDGLGTNKRGWERYVAMGVKLPLANIVDLGEPTRGRETKGIHQVI